ncbi:transcription factor IIE [Heterostelium album PN500]|uniref:Transcription factor IIE n=1 Tax=Heterostelium pallidum (strain ATCC 26659 / Pp 5 / PN500) TaxID=670386 RepID=D3BNZ0_HETP5|nr:transcription factor IIE [Heterostelium album PN500]EFA76909.1 transcription factor IIE [Heterostelium album PN500]|eukprot:XP_020429041.1 transcription factor IIE [Heterostelium album PN500]
MVLKKIKILDKESKLAFYHDEHVVVIDALLREKRRVRDEDLALKLRLPTKFVRKVLSDLKNDSLLKSQEIKVEPKGPGDRATNVVLWYLDYKYLIDVLKYRLYKIRQKLDEQKAKKLDLQSYRCTNCSKMFTAYDIPRLLNPMEGTLECDTCGGLPQEVINAETQRANTDQFVQIKKIIDQLKKTDGLQIPLFARDLADDTQAAGPSLTINSNTNPAFSKPIGAFTRDTSSNNNNNNTVRGWIDPSAQNLEFYVDIYDSDNIDGLLPSTVKKEIKKTGVSVPPWLLSTISKPSELEAIAKSKVSTETVKIEKQPPLNVIPAKTKPLDEKFYIDYINKHFKDDMNKDKEKDKDKDGESPIKKREPSDDIGLVPKKAKFEHLPEIYIGDSKKPINQITEEDQENMTSQEYEKFNKLKVVYIYKLKNNKQPQQQQQVINNLKRSNNNNNNSNNNNNI